MRILRQGKFSFLEDFSGLYFTCDDDIVYPKYYIKSLKYYLKLNDYRAAVGWHGAILSDNFKITMTRHPGGLVFRFSAITGKVCTYWEPFA